MSRSPFFDVSIQDCMFITLKHTRVLIYFWVHHITIESKVMIDFIITTQSASESKNRNLLIRIIVLKNLSDLLKSFVVLILLNEVNLMKRWKYIIIGSCKIYCHLQPDLTSSHDKINERLPVFYLNLLEV